MPFSAGPLKTGSSPTVAPAPTGARAFSAGPLKPTTLVQGAQPQGAGIGDILGMIFGGPTGVADHPQAALDFGTGVVKSAADTTNSLFKIGSAPINWLSKIPGLGFLNSGPDSNFQPAKQVDQFSKPTNTGQQVGKTVGDVAQFFIPGEGEEALASKAGKAIDAAKALPDAVKTGLNIATKAGIGAGSTAAVSGLETGGDPNAIKTGAIFGGVGGALTEGLSALAKNSDALQRGLGENVSKALGISGKQTTGSLVAKTANAEKGLKVIADNAGGAMVKDVNGIEHAFNPSKATFYDTLQAWQIARDKVYKAYTDLATKAGDEGGASFTAKDFNAVESELQSLAKNSTSAFKNKVESLIADMRANYATVNPVTKAPYYRNIPLTDIQSFLEKVNTDVNPGSDAAGAKVSLTAAQKIRDILDEKISNATGEGYQALRNQYASLKSIEKDLGNQFKKVYRGSGGWFSNYVEGFGGVDAILGLITKSPSEIVRGGLVSGVGKLIQMARDPERKLRAAFDIIQNGVTPNALGRIVNAGQSTIPIATKVATPLFTGQENQ